MSLNGRKSQIRRVIRNKVASAENASYYQAGSDWKSDSTPAGVSNRRRPQDFETDAQLTVDGAVRHTRSFYDDGDTHKAGCPGVALRNGGECAHA
jgi:hypothetical protein